MCFSGSCNAVCLLSAVLYIKPASQLISASAIPQDCQGNLLTRLMQVRVLRRGLAFGNLLAAMRMLTALVLGVVVTMCVSIQTLHGHQACGA